MMKQIRTAASLFADAKHITFCQLLCGDQCHYTTESALRKAKKKSAALAARENGLVIPE